MSTHQNSYSTNHDSNQDMSKKLFGFWIYILQDLFLFATLFANFSVFAASYAGGPTGKDRIDLLFVFFETMLLLISSFTYGLSMINMKDNNLVGTKRWMGCTFILGCFFIFMELHEFNYLINNGSGPWVSAYWSAFFILVGTHGIHVFSGLIWMLCMFLHLKYNKLSLHNKTRLMCLSIFWHFLDIVWVFVFTIVYLLGAL